MISVVIVGRPNVGKSTLFNRIVGRRRALVHNQPGVTRDRIVQVAQHGGKRFQLVDTGGILGASEDPIHALVEEQVEVALAEGDRVVFLVDAQEGCLPVEREIARKLLRAGKQITLAVNKVDVDGHLPRQSDFFNLGAQAVFPVSAEHGLGVQELLDHVLRDVPEEAEDSPLADPEGQIRVAIVGKPNVGKSSLLNHLLGKRRALVSPVAGTTRDPVDAPLEAGGRSFLLVDTAGIRRKSKTEKGAEVLSVILARRAIDSCHVALLVLDASAPPSHQDAHIAGLIEEARRASIFVMNKWDLVKGEVAAKKVEEDAKERFAFIDYAPLMRISAHTGRGVEKLLPLVARTYDHFARPIPTSALNKALQEAVRRVSPPAARGKELKFKYATLTGTAPPIVTVFTNSIAPPPQAYARYLKNQLRESFRLEGSPLILKFRKD